MAFQPVTEAPVFGPGNDEDGAVTIALTSPTEGASIAYTTASGETPHWLLYSGPLTLPVPVTVRAIAVRYGYEQSEEVSVQYPDNPRAR